MICWYHLYLCQDIISLIMAMLESKLIPGALGLRQGHERKSEASPTGSWNFTVLYVWIVAEYPTSLRTV